MIEGAIVGLGVALAWGIGLAVAWLMRKAARKP